ncbi:ribose transport system substrate-binding protein [Variovorax boronicumulans]|jgi:ribose transport system substrate-binding protein|uniref:Ribose transport system substrate-binding protein n=2 Tax=Variovorax TaxID=34072 RepID=A0AAW8CMP4_9BURK|nr:MULTISPECIES: ABC transporter substrate-binding protein [Variovorax]ADU38009.1 ABC sugar transporter, periplasmic ligand binding protein [Variovorax paradoxus EPS]MDP9891577.1 ribose transport system substrate-binding protein [Variovorax boronicumulans]MDQ0035128.1 ribose transport system substrate-binding protein [Variovorax boronicumulans]MDQ0051645.1 ribose transport system substrate-binding protein [Variovorax boronicumulans]MDQ0070509.1 ribose transport system substrate-binding protein
MTNRRIFSGIALAVCALASMPALAQNKAMVMGVSVPAATHGWTGGVVYWANRTKAELEKQYPGIKVFVKTAGSATEQANQVQDLQTVNKIDTLVILPFESAPLTKPVAQVKSKGVFVTVVDRGLTDPNAQSAYVAGDNPGFGKVAGEYMAKTMGGKGNVVILRGIPTVIDNQRVDAFNEVMKANPGIKVLDAKHGNWNRDDAFKVMQDYLTRFKQIDAVWASDDDMAVGVQKAIEQAKRDDVKLVVGGAGAKGYIKKVMDGDKIVSADVTYAPSMIADAMNLTAKSRVEGGAMPATTIIPSVLVTKENAAKYYFPDSPF